MQSNVMEHLLYIKGLCWFRRKCARPCNMPKNRLKIRRSQGRGGSTPPPGTKYLALESIKYSRDFRLCPECAQKDEAVAIRMAAQFASVKPLTLRAVGTPIYPTPQGRCCVRGAGQI